MSEAWLNGWHRSGTRVLIDASNHCAGCGKDLGCCFAVYADGYVRPEKMPDWPFEESNCPICELEIKLAGRFIPPIPRTAGEAYLMREAVAKYDNA